MNSDTLKSYRSCQIEDFEAITEFRQTAYAVDPKMIGISSLQLISDRWDSCSTHLGLLHGNQLVGAARFATPIEGRLPVHEYFPRLDVPNPVRELSRGIIHPEHRNFVAAAIFSKFIYEQILADPTNIIVDALLRHSHNHTRGHLLRIGLVDTGIRYWDRRYASESGVFIGEKEAVVNGIKDYLWN